MRRETRHGVIATDVVPEKVEKVNNRISPIKDTYIEQFLREFPLRKLRLRATLDAKEAYRDAEYVVIAAPTNYDPEKNFFDTSHVEEVIDAVLEVNPDAVMVIKSTIPIGYTDSLYLKYKEKGIENLKLLFSPEFLREGQALYDNLYPSRIMASVFSQWESEISISLPAASSSETPSRLPGEVILNVARDGSVTVNARKLTLNDLGERLRKVADFYPGQPVVIRADRETSYDSLVKVLDTCRVAGVWNFSLATVEEKEPAGK